MILLLKEHSQTAAEFERPPASSVISITSVEPLQITDHHQLSAVDHQFDKVSQQPASLNSVPPSSALLGFNYDEGPYVSGMLI